MYKLNNKGFSLVEVLAVIVILGVLAVIMVPVINNVINQNKEDNYNNLKKSILSAAKSYVSDNRYNIELYSSPTCSADNTTRNIKKISNITITNNKLYVDIFTDYLSNTSLVNPKTNKKLNNSSSYVVVMYDCNTKDYTFNLVDSYLVWSS